MNGGARSIRVLMCGACMSGNMGGQALYVAMAGGLRQLMGEVDIGILSKYPREDRAPALELGWNLIPFPSMKQIVLGIPFSVLFPILRRFGLSRRWLACGPLAAYLDYDVLVDLSGISFTDDRALTGLVINSLWLMPAIATGMPYVKASQTMGPFQRLPVRIAARFFLSRASALVARGETTAGHLKAIFPSKKALSLPDVAFALRQSPANEVRRALKSAGIDPERPYVVVGPSYVVDQLMTRNRSRGVYAELLAKVTQSLVLLTGAQALLVPHERAHAGSALDDIVVCEEVYGRLDRTDSVRVLRSSSSAALLKGIIAGAEVAVGSRFHFMVAAMSSGVPGLSISWSHKYSEMMAMLGQAGFAIDHADLEEASLLARVSELWETRSALRAQIVERLPEVIRLARENARVVQQVVSGELLECPGRGSTS